MLKAVTQALPLLHADLRAIVRYVVDTSSIDVINDYQKQVGWTVGKLFILAKWFERRAIISEDKYAKTLERAKHEAIERARLHERWQRSLTDSSNGIFTYDTPLHTAEEMAQDYLEQWNEYSHDAQICWIVGYRLLVRLWLTQQIVEVLQDVELSDKSLQIVERLLQFDNIKPTDTCWLDEWIITTQAVETFNRQFEIDIRKMLATIKS